MPQDTDWDASRDACAEVDNSAVYSAFDRCHRALGTLYKHGSSLPRRLRSSRTAYVTFFRSHNSLRAEEAVVEHRLDQSVLEHSSLRVEEAVVGHRDQSVLEHGSVVEVGDLQVHQIPHVLLLSELAVPVHRRQRIRGLCLILRTQSSHVE
jgi:hypothetical protein